VAQNIVLARSPYQLLGRVAAQSESAFVPVQDPTVTIDKVDSIAHLVEQFLIESGVGWNHWGTSFSMLRTANSGRSLFDLSHNSQRLNVNWITLTQAELFAGI
jgi:hypothetical protein